jgi:hypothetical protein
MHLIGSYAVCSLKITESDTFILDTSISDTLILDTVISDIVENSHSNRILADADVATSQCRIPR